MKSFQHASRLKYTIWLQELFTETHKALLERFADRIVTDPRAAADCRVAALIASGKLHRRSAIYCTVRLLSEMADAQMSGRVKQCQSVPTGCSERDMCESGFLLASACRNTEAMRKFGYTTPENQKPDWFGHSNPNLPAFFQSHRNPTILKQGTRQSLEHMGVAYCRNYCLLCDETNFNPGSLAQRKSPP